MNRVTSVVLLLSAIFGISAADCYCDDTYSCDCYVPVYLSWWFWVVVVGAATLKFVCIGCCVRNRRRRMQMYYIPAPTVQTTVSTRTTVTVPTAARVNQQMPPPYPGNAPPYYPHPSHQMMNMPQPQPTIDSRVVKDTQMLVG